MPQCSAAVAAWARCRPLFKSRQLETNVRVNREEAKQAYLAYQKAMLAAETSLLNAEDQVVQSRQALAQNLVAVYKALGGGWNADDLKRVEVSDAAKKPKR